MQGSAERTEGHGRALPDEGWTFYPVPGPNFKGNAESAAADSNYYSWVDKYDTFGLGKNLPIGNRQPLRGRSLFLKDGKWVVGRVPYPMGFFVKQVDGRVDDPKAGWKGKGLWTTYANRTPWHLEGGKGTRGEGGEVPDASRPARQVTDAARQARPGTGSRARRSERSS